jgi:AcrR family transcriptional regulator
LTRDTFGIKIPLVSEMAVRLTRNERRAQTRADLVAAARRVFLKDGFHAASLDGIAEDAGYTKGAVYSNFESKDDLFLALLDAHFAERASAYPDVFRDHDGLEGSLRAVARFMAEAEEREPRWAPLLLEFWTHASRNDALRRAVVERRERFLEAIARLIDELGARHGVHYRLPAKEIARGSAALARGVALERLLDPDGSSADAFEEMHTAYVTGLLKARDESEPSRDGRGER